MRIFIAFTALFMMANVSLAGRGDERGARTKTGGRSAGGKHGQFERKDSMGGGFSQPGVYSASRSSLTADAILSNYAKRYGQPLSSRSAKLFKSMYSKYPRIGRGFEKSSENDILKMVKNWGACEQRCYDERNRCFNMGNSASICDPIYDSCVTYCREESFGF